MMSSESCPQSLKLHPIETATTQALCPLGAMQCFPTQASKGDLLDAQALAHRPARRRRSPAFAMSSASAAVSVRSFFKSSVSAMPSSFLPAVSSFSKTAPRRVQALPVPIQGRFSVDLFDRH